MPTQRLDAVDDTLVLLEPEGEDVGEAEHVVV
jgi:hypothetical protein